MASSGLPDISDTQPTLPISAPREKFQGLLRELFQIQDAAELGIYRIMGQKRGIIEKFIDRELLDVIDAELRTGALKKESAATSQVAELGGYDYIDCILSE